MGAPSRAKRHKGEVMNKQFWKADWFLGLVIAIAMLVFNAMSGTIPGLERWAYDLGVRMTSKNPSDKIAVIAIDEQSIANIGRWPWPREVQAKLIDQLSAAKARVIGNTVFFFEPQKDPGLTYVEKMLDLYNKAYPQGAPQEAPGVGIFGAATPAAQVAQPPAEMAEIGKMLREASNALNSDTRLRYAGARRRSSCASARPARRTAHPSTGCAGSGRNHAPRRRAASFRRKARADDGR